MKERSIFSRFLKLLREGSDAALTLNALDGGGPPIADNLRFYTEPYQHMATPVAATQPLLVTLSLTAGMQRQ